MRIKTPLLALLVLAGCSPGDETDPASAPAAEQPRYAPGQEPLETEIVSGDEVQTLPVERGSAIEAPRPCGWSSAWKRDDVPDPLLAGVGGVPMPTKVGDASVMLPQSDRAPSEVVAEIVIGVDGRVYEATLLRTPEPRWPEAEQALLEALRQWTYEPVEFEDARVSVCTTLMMRI